MSDEPLNLMPRLKRHHIFRVASVYAIPAWILIQVANGVLPDIGLSRANQRFRFMKAEAVAAARVSTATPAPLAVTAIPAKSIAVLPMVNQSGDPREQCFSDGLSEDRITALSQFSGLKVISRDSSFRFRNSEGGSQVIGEKLGVAHLLEGSVSREGNEVRIIAELVNAADGKTLWAQHYDWSYKDLFALQDDITNRDSGMQYLLYAPFILRYKNDPRFGAFCRKVDLPVPGDVVTGRAGRAPHSNTGSAQFQRWLATH